MRVPLSLTIGAIACVTITYGFVKVSNVSFDSRGHSDQVEQQFQATWNANKQDEQSRTQLAWLCCETRRYGDARKIFEKLHAARSVGTAYSAAYASDFDNMAQVEIGDTKFDKAYELYQEKLAYDQRFVQPDAAQLVADRNAIAVTEAMMAQVRSNHKDWNTDMLNRADADLKAALATTKDPAHKLICKENALLVAEQRGDLGAIEAGRRDVDEARSHLRVTVAKPPY